LRGRGNPHAPSGYFPGLPPNQRTDLGEGATHAGKGVFSGFPGSLVGNNEEQFLRGKGIRGKGAGKRHFRAGFEGF